MDWTLYNHLDETGEPFVKGMYDDPYTNVWAQWSDHTLVILDDFMLSSGREFFPLSDISGMRRRVSVDARFVGYETGLFGYRWPTFEVANSDKRFRLEHYGAPAICGAGLFQAVPAA